VEENYSNGIYPFISKISEVFLDGYLSALAISSMPSGFGYNFLKLFSS
jgi:hypothetical protein